MVAGLLFSGVMASVAGFAAALIAGHALHHALLAYSLAGLCGSLTFTLAVVRARQDLWTKTNG